MTRRRGLVLGAGGALGAAWMLGALSALDDVEGFDPRAVDQLVGTSAGSVLAALLGTGVPLDELTDRLSGSGEPDTGGTGPVNAFDVHAALAAIPRPVLLPGNVLLAARSALRAPRHPMMTVMAGLAPRGRGDLEPVAELIEGAQGEQGWPQRPATWVVAMDYDSGRRTVFGRPGAPPAQLSRAVAASCAAPGFFPPVTIGARRYVDGGAVSMTNADVLLREELDEIIVLAPMAGLARRPGWSPAEQADRRLRAVFTRRLGVEAKQLAATGAVVRIIAPTAADLSVMGFNMMNPARRHDVLTVARQTTREQLNGRRRARIARLPNASAG